MSEKYKNNRKKESRLQKIYGSQNFLTSRRLLERIVRKSTITKNDIVIEIGTGKGHLAEVLCRKADYVCSIEIDKKLYEHTKERLKNVNNLKIIFGDFMKYKLPDKGNYKVFSNIPYYLTTEIVRKLTENANPPSEIWLVMEKGAAKRFLGVPAETKYSLSLKYRWKLDIVYFFKKEDFHPKPSVDSVLLHFLRK
ncbi:MAG: 23S rRNA (adenine(2058)-N(6))-methyltransferase Erm(Q) [Lachnospiraceae bacterium]|nr:23S rRNA (adenine(2058)-N(6))-methyltransferase Erm(Q) [Lachnospiraceae bacterium]